MDKHIEKIAKLLKNNETKVVFFVGAGISTNCGIPDFRSPETGLYANLKRLDLPYPEAVFDIDYFKKNPKAFYTLADELYPGKFLPSKFHYFIRLCQEKNLLKRCYTQNIDTLERIAGVNDELVVEAHGSFVANHCINCKHAMDTETLKKLMKITIPTCPKCDSYVKPDIVFFGEALPVKFFDCWDEDVEDIDLAVIAGTSLAVYPFASLPAEVAKKSQRMLINRELCGDFETYPRKSDVVLLEDCDAIAQKLCKLLDWEDELLELIENGKKEIEKNKRGEDDVEIEKAKELSEELASEIAAAELNDLPKKTEEEEKREEEINVLTEKISKVKLGAEKEEKKEEAT